MTNAVTGNVTVQYVLVAGTATSGIDYTYTGGTATITAGSTGTTIAITTIEDAIYEGTESFQIILSNVGGSASLLDGTGVATITDDDSAPTISVNDTTISEGDAGSFAVTLTNAVTGNVTVQYVLVAGTATSGVDYTYTGGTATITAGSTGTTIAITTIEDAIYEGTESFQIILSNVGGSASLLDGTGVATITDDDSAPTISVNDTTISEGDAGSFAVTLTNAVT